MIGKCWSHEKIPQFFRWKLPGIQSHLVRCLEPSLEMSSQSMRFLQLLGSWAANERNSCEGLLGCLPFFLGGDAEKSLQMLYLQRCYDVWCDACVERGRERERERESCVCVFKFERPCTLGALLRRSMSIYIYIYLHIYIYIIYPYNDCCVSMYILCTLYLVNSFIFIYIYIYI